MNIVFGVVRVADPEYRCNQCTGLAKPPKEPRSTHTDPVCRTPGKFAVGHTWLEVENPVTNFFRTVIRGFWERECKAFALENPAAEMLKSGLKTFQ